MIRYLKENNFPVDLEIETIPPEKEDSSNNYHHKVFVNKELVEEFDGFFIERKSYARGFFKGYEIKEKINGPK